MSAIGLSHYLIVSALLFCLGLLGVIVRRNVLVIYMSLELMLNAGNLALVAARVSTTISTGRSWSFLSSRWRRRKWRWAWR